MESSFRLDESENPFKDLPTNACSTPKVVRKKLVCQMCGREYVSQFYYDKHVRSHTAQVFADAANVSTAVHLDVSDLSLVQLRPDDNTNVFKVPAPPAAKKTTVNASKSKKQPQKKKPHLVCTYCQKGYVCSRSFKSHIRTHTLQEAASRFPNAKTVIESAKDIATAALTITASSPSFGPLAENFRAVVGHVVQQAGNDCWLMFSSSFCKEIVKDMEKKKCMLPSALTSHIFDHLETALSDNVQYNYYLEILELSDNFESGVNSQFFLEFGLNFATEILKFIAKTFRNNLPSQQVVQRPIAEPDKEDRQVIYYIAGSIMRGYLKIARRAKKSPTWQSVAIVLKSKVLIEKPEGDIDPDSEWTQQQDRGSLLYINSISQSFFVNLTKVIFQSESRDGSIDYEAVITKVSNANLSVEWDNVISDSLQENVSLGLMNDVVLCMCRTCGRGFAKRRLNFLREKPLVSMPTRHLVASRKNR